MVNWSKSFISFGDVVSKHIALLDFSGMRLGKVPLVYFRVALFKVRLSMSHLRTFADSIVDQFDA